MQVSWIDPDELARLAAELNGPLPAPEAPTPWDLSTLPDITADTLMPPSHQPPPPAISEPVRDVPEVQVPATQPALAHIREKLRAIRTRAQDAGILPKQPEPAPVAAAPMAPPAAESPAMPVQEVSAVPAPPPLPGAEMSEASSPAPGVEASGGDPVAVSAASAASHAFLNLDGVLTERLSSFMSWAERYVPSKEVLLVDDHGELLWGNPTHPELALSAVLAANVSLRNGAEAITQQPATSLRLSDDKTLTVLPCTTRLGLVTLALLNANPEPTQEQISCLREALTLSVEGKS